MSSMVTSSPFPLSPREAYTVPQPDQGRKMDLLAYTKSHLLRYAIWMRRDHSISQTASKNTNKAL